MAGVEYIIHTYIIIAIIVYNFMHIFVTLITEINKINHIVDIVELSRSANDKKNINKIFNLCMYI